MLGLRGAGPGTCVRSTENLLAGYSVTCRSRNRCSESQSLSRLRFDRDAGPGPGCPARPASGTGRGPRRRAFKSPRPSYKQRLASRRWGPAASAARSPSPSRQRPAGPSPGPSRCQYSRRRPRPLPCTQAGPGNLNHTSLIIIAGIYQ